MLTFNKVLEKIDESHSNNSEEFNDKAIATIKTGLNLDEDFWDNFKNICNSPGLGELLGVSKNVISTWYSKIDKHLNKVEEMELNSSKRNKMIKTGYEDE
jgi:hypothetical protein